MTPPNLHCYIYSSDEGLVAKFYQTMKPELNSNPLAYLANEAALKRWQSSCVKTVKVHPTHAEKVRKRVRLNSHQVVLDHIETDFKEGMYCEGIETKFVHPNVGATNCGDFKCSGCNCVEYAFLSDNKREEKDENLFESVDKEIFKFTEWRRTDEGCMAYYQCNGDTKELIKMYRARINSQ